MSIEESSASKNEVVSVIELKSTVLPALFKNPTSIGEYGALGSDTNSITEFSNLMERGDVSKLASAIEAIVDKLADADPKTIARDPSWFQKLLGRDVERYVRYQVARTSLDEQLTHAEVLADSVRGTLHAIERLIANHGHEATLLKVYIQAGREYLAENNDLVPTVSVNSPEFEFDRPRERFARKLANLATLLASHEMSVTQLKLTRAQAVDMLDRFMETTSVLVPVWRQHTLALVTTNNMTPEMVTQANRAHEALKRSLSGSLQDLQK